MLWKLGELDLQLKVREVKVHRALSPSGIYGVDFSLNPYVGCQHACVYCYVPFTYPSILRGRKWGAFVDVKVNVPRLVRREVKALRDASILVSSITDPYQPLEARYGLTRACLEAMQGSGVHVVLLTKSSLFRRDLDLLQGLKSCEVGITVTTLNLSKIVEPFSPPPHERFKAIKEASEVGLETFLFLGPLLPAVVEQELKEILDSAVEHGCGRVVVDKFRLRPRMKEKLSEVLSVLDDQDTFLSKVGQVGYFEGLKKEISMLCSERGLEVVFCY